ncbi:MAG: SOS response-associated peptidase [Desulfobacterales bacterium]|nr:SOS response-associated peptidase [Desulfobacterales bacterium]
MCGRVSQHSPPETLIKVFGIDTVAVEAVPSYNTCPADDLLSVVQKEGKNRLVKLHWGFVPSWSKDVSRTSRPINARAESLSLKPLFRAAFKHRRCLIAADGFYEWKKSEGRKQPFYFTLPSGGPFGIAGLWEKYEGAEKTLYSCAIITTEAGKSVRHIHHRMPVILLPEAYQTWLDAQNNDFPHLEKLIRDCHVQEMRSHPVSTFVNSPKNNNPSCIAPLI